MNEPLRGIRALVFDAVGTLIVPDPPAVAVYAEAGRRHGCALPSETIALRFREAFRREEERDRMADWAVDEEREQQRWRMIVGHVFHGVGDEPHIDALFRDLWQHFARPSAWRVADAATEVVRALAERGYVLGIASNFDRRLFAVLDGLPDLAPLRFRLVSSEVGWRKPDARFFAAVALAAGCAPCEILYVGDHRENDYDAATAGAMQAVLLTSDTIPNVRIIQDLRELI